jgi:holo-[acyl-carrier protein] synthase
VSPPVKQRIQTGVDIVWVDRVARLVREHGAFQEQIFTDEELAYCLPRRRRYEHMAARFAAKEAVLKAFGSGLAERMRWTDVEIVRGAAGRPSVRLHGRVAERAAERRLIDLDVSLSHTEGLAVAHAIAVWPGDG